MHTRGGSMPPKNPSRLPSKAFAQRVNKIAEAESLIKVRDAHRKLRKRLSGCLHETILIDTVNRI